MKIFKTVTAFICTIMIFCSCEQNEEITTEPETFSIEKVKEFESYAPLNTIPDWVKKRVTPEELKLWNIMSTRYEIDYSFLNKDMSKEKRIEFIGCIKNICGKITNGDLDKYQGMFTVGVDSSDLSFQNQGVKRIKTTREVEGDVESRTKECTVITNRYDVYIKAAVIYDYNRSSGAVTIVTSSVYAGSMYEGRNPSFQGASNVSYNDDSKLIVVSCVGTLSYYLENGGIKQKVEESISKIMNMYP